MQRVFFLFLVVAGGFVWLTSGNLPPVVASHFGPGGAANGFMNKGTYLSIMLTMVVAIPALIAISGQVVRIVPLELVNLPNKDYWLAPQRRAATLASLSSMGLPLAFVIAVFLCYVHWLVLQANAVQPARLSEASMITGLEVLGLVTALWLFALFRRFGRAP
jgi:uncharacterized membrane protein